MSRLILSLPIIAIFAVVVSFTPVPVYNGWVYARKKADQDLSAAGKALFNRIDARRERAARCLAQARQDFSSGTQGLDFSFTAPGRTVDDESDEEQKKEFQRSTARTIAWTRDDADEDAQYQRRLAATERMHSEETRVAGVKWTKIQQHYPHMLVNVHNGQKLAEYCYWDEHRNLVNKDGTIMNFSPADSMFHGGRAHKPSHLKITRAFSITICWG